MPRAVGAWSLACAQFVAPDGSQPGRLLLTHSKREGAASALPSLKAVEGKVHGAL